LAGEGHRHQEAGEPAEIGQEPFRVLGAEQRRDEDQGRVAPLLQVEEVAEIAGRAGLTAATAPSLEAALASLGDRAWDGRRPGFRGKCQACRQTIQGIHRAAVARMRAGTKVDRAWERPPRVLICGSLYLAGAVLAANGTPPV
jgi:folylpolyglutamate synthase/dihydropteroate synthase